VPADLTSNPASDRASDGSPRLPSSLLSDATLSTAGALGATVLSGIASIIIARSLGVTARGRWAVISSLAVTVGTIGGAGLPIATAYAAARLRGAARRELVQSALVATVVCGCLSALVYLILGTVLQLPAPTAAVVVGAAIPAATIAYAVTHQLTLTVGSMRWFAVIQLANALVTLVAVGLLALTFGLTVLAVVIISAGGSAVGAVVSLVALRRSAVLGTRPWVKRPVAIAAALRPYLLYALMTFATLSLTQIVQRVDVLLIGGYRGPHAAGLYAVAVQVTDLMLVVPAALGLAMFRRGANSAPTHYKDARILLRLTGAIAVIGALVALVLGGWIIPLVFGSAYRGSVDPFRLLLPGTIAFSLQSVLSQYLAGRGRPRIVLIAWITGAVLGLVADLIVIPAYGITGAAVVSSASYVIVTGLHLHGFRQIRPPTAAVA
jgi:O-antigen/teichoic acid export membrane protein